MLWPRYIPRRPIRPSSLPSMLDLVTFGGLALRSRSASRVPTLSPQRLALLAVVGAAGRAGVTRDALLAIFWPDSDADRARNSLNQALFVLRRELPAGAIVDGSVDLRLDPAVVACDAARFDAALTAGDPSLAVSCYDGAFLDGVHLRGSPEFERWRDETAARFAMRFHDALEQLATRAGQTGDADAAVGWWLRRVNADPLDARAILRLMQAHVAAGAPVAAVRVARVHERLVREQLGTASDPKVRTFADQLRQEVDGAMPAPSVPASETSLTASARRSDAIPDVPGVPAANEARASLPLPSSAAPADATPSPPTLPRETTGLARARAVAATASVFVVAMAGAGTLLLQRRDADRVTLNSVAVLPFAAIGDSLTRPADYVGEGIREEVLGALAPIHGLVLMARGSTDRFRDPDVDVQTLAGRLGVDAVVTGSVRRDRGSYRASVQLRRGDGSAIWGANIERDTGDLFGLQRAIAHGVTSAIRPARGAPVVTSIAGETRDPVAYALYLQGLAAARRSRPDELRAGIAFFERAVARDSTFGLAWAARAQALYLMDTIPDAYLAAARRAVAVDDRVAGAHGALGSALYMVLDWQGAEREFRRAFELNPNDPTAHSLFGLMLVFQGRFDEGLRELEYGRRLDPLRNGLHTNLAWGYYYARRYAKAEAVMRQALALDSTIAAMHNGLGRVLQHSGRMPEAITEYRRALAMNATLQAKAFLAQALARNGELAEATRLAAEVEASAPANPVQRAIVAIGFGHLDRAAALLAIARPQEPANLSWLAVDPIFDPLRRDPRFGAILTRLGLPETF